MEIYNSTSFRCMPFQSKDAHGAGHFTLVLRGAFEIIDGEVLSPLLEEEDDHETQRDIIVADTYYGDTATSSLHWPNDLAYFKPNADIHILGAARSEGEELLTSWKVKAKIGNLVSELEVTGRREWIYHEKSQSWILTDPEPCVMVPLRYELASGGTWGDAENGGVSEWNPIGRGCCSILELDKEQSIPAPQILCVGEEVPKLGETTPPQGFAPIPPAWRQRLQHAGTYDEEWENHQHPLPPHDFKYDFYNAAHPNLIYDGFLEGGEKVELEGVQHSGKVSFNIPKYNIMVELVEKSGFSRNVNVEMDTLQIDVEAKRAYIIWRVFVPYREGFIGANIELEENQ